jgi:hypothetical protein
LETSALHLSVGHWTQQEYDLILTTKQIVPRGSLPIRFKANKREINYVMAAPLEIKNAAADITVEEVRQTLARIIQSKYFSHAPKKQKFVQLICEYYIQGRAAELNEYLIGCEVFEKGAGYSPSVDPVVRVGAHDVRKKLELYYQHEGTEDPIHLTIPVGTYVPVFLRVSEAQDTNGKTSSLDDFPAVAMRAQPELSTLNSVAIPLIQDVPATNSRFRDWLEQKIAPSATSLLLLLGAITLILLTAVIGLISYSQNLQKRIEANQRRIDERESSDAQSSEAGREIWQPFLSNPNSTLLILSNPLVHRPVNAADPDVLTKQGIKLTPAQASLLSNVAGHRLPLRPNQPLTLVPAFNMYTGIGEAIGAYRISSLLQGLGKATLLKQSRSVGSDDLKDHDVILLGSVYANQWAKPLSIKENFIYSDHATIENLSPQTGEAREYAASFDQRTGTLLEDYALITVVPGVSGTNTMMFLAGIYSEGTQAAAEYVTDQNHLVELMQRLEERNVTKPRYFQALLKVRVENSFPTQVTLVTMREL